MQSVCVLIARPRSTALDQSALNATRRLIGGDPDWRWLAEREACEVGLGPEAANDKTLTAEIRTALADRPIDIAIVPVNHRRKHLLIADMDSTMIEQECIDELGDALGLKAEISAITERAMRGEIAFEPAVRERVAMLKGIDRATIARIIDERITLTPGGRTLVHTMRAQGAYTALVSGGFSIFTEVIARRIGFDMQKANTLGFEGDALSGEVVPPILGQEAKRTTLRALRKRLSLSPEQALAVGDGANDLAMIHDAGLGVAFRAKPAVAEAADIAISHGDLTALLYVQGYSQAEFAI